MNVITMILLVFAFVLFVLAGAPIPGEPWRPRLIAFGLACATLAILLSRAGLTT